jgi:hypothetical protein
VDERQVGMLHGGCLGCLLGRCVPVVMWQRESGSVAMHDDSARSEKPPFSFACFQRALHSEA